MAIPFAVPPAVALARSAAELPAAAALRGGALYEPKWDGFRAVLVVDDGAAAIWSRQGKQLTAAFPELVEAAAAQIPDGCVVDGEAVAWVDGRLSFDTLQQRLGTTAARAARLAAEQPASFVAFDVLAVAGADVRSLPLEQRRQLLDELGGWWRPPLHLSMVTDQLQQAREWFDDLAAAGIEGIVAKAAAGPYTGGGRDWIKVKRRETLDVVLGAVIGPITRPEAVVVGRYDEAGQLRVEGRSAPLQSHVARQLGAQLREAAPGHPWPTMLAPGALGGRFTGARDPIALTLVEPVVVEVSADVATAAGAFRHLVRFVRLRLELDPRAIVQPST